MHDDDSLDDSWFERPAAGRAPLTVQAVREAMANPGATTEGPRWEGLEDSWFDRPPRERRRG
jgi:hypothetical protein